MATRSVVVDAARRAGPSTPAQGGVHGRHWLLVRRSPPITPRLTTTIHPARPWRTSCTAGIGPAPVGTVVGDGCQASWSTGLVITLNPSPKTTAWTAPAAASTATTCPAPTGSCERD